LEEGGQGSDVSAGYKRTRTWGYFNCGYVPEEGGEGSNATGY
jgi:hypothetical protein